MNKLWDRRKFAGMSAAAVAGAALGTSVKARAGQARRPNVLFIIVDQMRQPKWIPGDDQLPNIGRLKSSGVEFTRSFCSTAPCSPSRACIISGLHPPRHGVVMNVRNERCPVLDPCQPNIGNIFKAQSYRTPYFGKWDLSLADYLAGHGLAEYGFEQWRAPDRHGLPYQGLTYDAGFTDQACGFLGSPESREQPWLLTLSLINPHDIMWAPLLDLPSAMIPNVADGFPPNFESDFSQRPRTHQLYKKGYDRIMGSGKWRKEDRVRHFMDFYHYLNRKVDAQIGRVLDALEQSDQADNTLVVLTSDHGEMAFSHGLQGKGPFIYDENINVPLVMSWPGHLPEGGRCEAPVQNVDLLPTLAAAAGVDVARVYPDLPGRDLLPAASSLGQVAGRDEVLFTVINRLEYADVLMNLAFGKQDQDFKVTAIMGRRYKFARYLYPDAEELELYDLFNDPMEMTNLAYDPGYAPIRKEQAEKLRDSQERELGGPLTQD